MCKDYKNSPLWDSSLSEKERLKFLLQELTLEEKFACLGTGCPAIERLGITAFGVGGEGAHGVQARHDQSYDKGEPIGTTIFPNPIGMSSSWDRELIKEAGTVVGNEARALYNAGKHGSLSLWAPTVDMERDPRWGRTEEGYGEDPYLTGEMAGAYVDGMQGEHPCYLRCGATLKHYYANNVEEGRTYISSSVDLRNKYEYYLEPFRKVITEHHVEGLMTAYNEVNGVPCMLLEKDIRFAKDWGLGHVVCDGGDVNQTVNFHKYFHRHSETIAAGLKAGIDCFTDDAVMVADAAREAFTHHMITEEDIDKALYHHFRVMLRLGMFDKEGRNPYSQIGMEEVGAKKNQDIARQMTAESVVLLKNDGFLPLKQEAAGKIAVIGPLSDVWYKDWYSGVAPYTVTPLEGICNALQPKENVKAVSGKSKVRIKVSTGVEEDRCYLGILEDGKSVGLVEKENAEVFLLSDWGDGKITLRAESNHLFMTTQDDETKGEKGQIVVTKEEAFGWFVREIFYLRENGELCTWDQKAISVRKDNILYKVDNEEKSALLTTQEVVEDGIEQAVDAARNAETVLLFLGAHPMITCKEEIDRTHIELPKMQRKLLEAVCEVNDHVVLVLISNVPYNICMAQNCPQVRSILLSASGSMELGNGIADILFGKTGPAGRLNMTWYQSLEGFPDINDYDIIQKGRTYQYYDGEVLYPFGYGLTYSDMEYDNLEVHLQDYTKLQVTAEITNTGGRLSDEVVQLYVHKKNAVVKRPHLSLKGFERMKDLQPGEKRKVCFAVSLEDLKYYDVIAKEKLLEPGEYEIMLGRSSRDILQTQTIYLSGTKRPCRDGFAINQAECFDSAKHHVLRNGHLGYTAVCTQNATESIQLDYEKMYLDKEAKSIVLDFWQEHVCDISIAIDGKAAGAMLLSAPEKDEEEQTQAGQANGSGAFDFHQNWITKRRETGFFEIEIPLENVPCNQEFTLTISWKGMGKICTYHFVE